MKKKNNKGFTLIELLAVIAILAVVMLIGGQSVFGALDSARKGAFKNEALGLIEAAQAAFQVEILNQTITSSKTCYPLSYLKAKGFYTKSGADADSYNGSVLVTTTGTAGAGTASYSVWFYNNQYQVGTATLGATPDSMNVANKTSVGNFEKCINTSQQTLKS